MFCKDDALIFSPAKFTRKHQCWESLFKKISGQESEILLKRDLSTVFPYGGCAKFLRASFLWRTTGGYSWFYKFRKLIYKSFLATDHSLNTYA